MGDAGPHQVHVDGQRRSRGRRCQPTLRGGDLFQTKAQSAVVLGSEHAQVPQRLQLREIFMEELIALVIALGSDAETLEQLIREQLI